jgi:ABC-type lipoprotein export system ATPase subunit
MRNIFKRKERSSNGVEFEEGEVIQLRGIYKTFSNAAGEFPVLKNINVRFFGGEFIGIIGKSGSGKSTLINMITGIDRPTTGGVYVTGHAVHEMNENRLARWRGLQMGIVFQFFQLLPTLSLVENIMLPMDFCRVYPSRQRRKKAMELLELVDMQEHARKLPSEISGGQQQRVAIARALANDPPILLADEPTGNLDSVTAEVIFGIFKQLVSEGKTVVMVTHDSSLAKRVNRTVLLADGQIVSEYIARALPQLTMQQMLKVTNLLQTKRFEPGAVILSQGAEPDQFYIVTKGRVEIALQRPGGSDVVVYRPGVGDYFGEIELMRGGMNLATARAGAEGAVELVALGKESFVELLQESEETRDALSMIVSARLAENLRTNQERQA